MYIYVTNIAGKTRPIAKTAKWDSMLNHIVIFFSYS